MERIFFLLMKKIFLFVLVLCSSCSPHAWGEQDIRVCTLNMHRLGEKTASIKNPDFRTQMNFLSKRVRDASCDVVALQEVPGKTKEISQKNLEPFIHSLNRDSSKTGRGVRSFEVVLADSNDSFIRNAVLYDANIFSLKSEKSWNRQFLPKLDTRSAPWSHVRGPLSVILEHKKKGQRDILIVNYHLKSKASGWKDPAGTKYELQRMIAATAIRDIPLQLIKEKKTNDPIVILLGDRNSDVSGAASEVLSGRLDKNDFSKNGSCRISEEGTALCPADVYKEVEMIPLLQKKASMQGIEIGTYRFRNRLQILDEIYINKKYFSRASSTRGVPQAGTEGEFLKGSDHLLGYVSISLEPDL